MNDVRRALLVGVGRVPDQAEGLEPLDAVVDADLRLMESALGSAGYIVETLLDPHLSQLKRRVYECARGMPADGTLLLYFTGHGIRIGGRDFLVPADAAWPGDGVWQEVYTDSLLPAAIGPLLKDCKAGTVLWVIDACRTDRADDQTPFGNTVDAGPADGGYAVLTGCSSGERSGYGPEGSFFTRGLADALGPLSPARTVTEVFEAARATTAKAARGSGVAQTASIVFGTNHRTRTQGTEICAGRSLREDWLTAALDTPLWDRVPQEQHEEAAHFRQCLAEFVESCARTLHHAQERLEYDDRWADDLFVVRLLHRRLPDLLPEQAELSAIEVASLVAVVFLREAAWAERLSQSAEVDPSAPGRKPGADAYRRHFEQTTEQYRSVARRVVECRRRGREADSAAVTMWLVHRWIADRLETDDTPIAPIVARRLLEAMGVSPDRAQEPAETLCAMAAGLDREGPLDTGAPAVPEKVLLRGGHRVLRVRPLTGLLRLAAVLAVDVRTFPDVVAEHLGVTDPVTPEQVIGVARELGWAREGDVLRLDAPCPHQAVHAALMAVVELADELTEEIAGLTADLPAPEVTLLERLPRRVTDGDLRPSRTAGRPAYDLPLLRFHLAQTEVRELLMGEQLYGGEPNLALRELYQNAMDACRYRAMRCQYLRSRGSDTGSWAGEITFSEGEDERGRYVECRDNGVGMSAEQLKHTFTRAGSRFERSKSFRREQARWLRHDPALRLYPNSRFGIGVFSYFMLAEEMTIVTREVNSEGIPAEHALRVDIPGSGSLFRIQRHSGADGLVDGGTRIRLYLREGTLAGSASCVSVLRGLVRISEFTLTARDADGGSHTWEAGALQPSPVAGEESLEAVPGVLWWVAGEGAVLCDGIVTDQKPFGCVLNLTGEHAGVLSVSRKELQEYDLEWAAGQWRAGAPALAAWPWLSMEWIWQLDQLNPTVAQLLGKEWRGQGLRVREKSGAVHDLDAVGWFYPDKHLLTAGYGVSGVEFQGWRRTALGKAARPPAPQQLLGHPVPQPGDGHLCPVPRKEWPTLVRYAADHVLPLSWVMRRRRAVGIAADCWVPAEAPAQAGSLDWIPSADQADFIDRLTSRPGQEFVYGDKYSIPSTLQDLVEASAKLGMPLGELAAQIAPFEPFGLPCVAEVPEHARRHVCDVAELDRLFTRRHGGRHSVHRACDVRLVCEETGAAPSEILAVLAAHSWLGWDVPDLQEVLAWMDLDAEDFTLLRKNLVFGDTDRATLSWDATTALAVEAGITLGEAEDHLAALATTVDLTYRRAFASADHPARGIHPTDETADFLERALATDTFFDTTTEPTLYNLMHVGQESLAQLRLMGVRIPSAHRVAQRWTGLPLRVRYVLGGKEYPLSEDSDFPAERFGTATLFNAACLLQEPLSNVAGLVRSDTRALGLHLPDLPEELLGHQPSEAERDALLGYVNEYGERDTTSGEAAWVPLTPARLARRAGHGDAGSALASLMRLRPLGALVPEADQILLDALSEEEPDTYDLHVLATFWPSSTDGAHTVTPLSLVRTAARIGDTPRQTAARYAPYLPLVAHLPDPPPDLSGAAPDTVPVWQDLIILTRHLDGQDPPLEGTVGTSELRRAADAVGESPAWVAQRLRVYAELFALHITEDTDA
ncbi:caspase family protein [Streptomyces sp. NPDC001904]|uniref:HD domain-containing protein n=1 Tax=Streptomyces sp. NPDC001904 TaxID=3154531 RepID=UPI003325B491